MLWGTPMSGKVTAVVGLHVAEKYRDESMMHTRSRYAALVPHRVGYAGWSSGLVGTVSSEGHLGEFQKCMGLVMKEW